MSTLIKYCQFHVLSTYTKVFSERKPIPFWKLQKASFLDLLAISIKKVDNMIDRRSLYQSWPGIGNIPTGPTSHGRRHYLSQAAIEAMQHESLAEHCGLAGIRDQGVLESALARCKNKSAYDSQRGRCCGDVYRRGSGRSDEGESCQVVRGAFESETIASLSTSAGRSMLHVFYRASCSTLFCDGKSLLLTHRCTLALVVQPRIECYRHSF